MLTVSKQCLFDAAHVLTNHSGQCKNLHGHTYRVIVEVAEGADRQDMVIDFKDLKQVIREVILERFDHAFIFNQASESECEIAAVITKHGMKIVGLPFLSTAQNLARYFHDQLSVRLNIASVKVYENPRVVCRIPEGRQGVAGRAAAPRMNAGATGFAGKGKIRITITIMKGTVFS